MLNGIYGGQIGMSYLKH